MGAKVKASEGAGVGNVVLIDVGASDGAAVVMDVGANVVGANVGSSAPPHPPMLHRTGQAILTFSFFEHWFSIVPGLLFSRFSILAQVLTLLA